ncbi:MAG: hypothetical protein WC091_24375 [Sulfuricellaceae bacterium]
MAIKFVVCVQNGDMEDFSADDLTVGRLYEVIGEEPHSMLRIVDDSGEDYLYPAKCFEAVAVQDNAARRVHDALNLLAA